MVVAAVVVRVHELVAAALGPVVGHGEVVAGVDGLDGGAPVLVVNLVQVGGVAGARLVVSGEEIVAWLTVLVYVYCTNVHV